MFLHSWGQLMNRHAHTHMIMTAGGLSLDGHRWIAIPDNHPAMQSAMQAAAFRKTFLRRIRYWLRRDALLWPEADGQVTPAKSPSADAGDTRSRPRELTRPERELLAQVEAKDWMVNCQPTPPEYQNGEAVINYLAAYVVGAAIGNGRLISDDGQQVTIRYKDYKAGDIKTTAIPGPRFVQLFCLHILPRGLLRVRYCGLFSACGRDARLEHCRQLIGIATEQDHDPARQTTSCDELVLPEPDEDEQPAYASCTCRYCQAELTVVGRLKGNPMLPVLAQLCGWVTDELLLQLQSGTLDLKCLPKPLRALLAGQSLSPLESSILAALGRSDALSCSARRLPELAWLQR